MAVATAHHWQTGIAHCSARRASASKPAGDPAPRWATIKGRSAEASSSATACACSGEATTEAGCIEMGAATSSPGHGSHSTSRGRLRYTGPFGVEVAMAWARSSSSGTCSGNRSS